MSNIKDYIKWRGDLSFDISPFNELDNLVCAGMSYINISDYCNCDDEIKFSDIRKNILASKIKLKPRHKQDTTFFPLLFASNRYKDAILTGYVKDLDPSVGIQFGAVTILLPDGTIYVSFSGTTESLVGWKEDLEMSFLDEVPAQKKSIEYLTQMANKYKDKKIIVGGHSKGGNLAMYSSIFVNDEIKDRIIKIYNNDGPGVQTDIAKNENYKKILPKIITYMPQTSVVGRMLIHEEKHKVVNSNQKGIYQHDYYSWQLCGTKFEYEKQLDKRSNRIDYSLTDFLEKLTIEQRKEFIDIFFDLLEKSDIKTMKDFTRKWYLHARQLINTYSELTPEQRQVIISTFESLYLSNQEARKQIRQEQKEEKAKQKEQEKIEKSKIKTNELPIERGINNIKKLIDKI